MEELKSKIIELLNQEPHKLKDLEKKIIGNTDCLVLLKTTLKLLVKEGVLVEILTSSKHNPIYVSLEQKNKTIKRLLEENSKLRLENYKLSQAIYLYERNCT